MENLIRHNEVPARVKMWITPVLTLAYISLS